MTTILSQDWGAIRRMGLMIFAFVLLSMAAMPPVWAQAPQEGGVAATEAHGEASLKLPDMSQVAVQGMNARVLLKT